VCIQLQGEGQISCLLVLVEEEAAQC
jgi:hypothetical protein